MYNRVSARGHAATLCRSVSIAAVALAGGVGLSTTAQATCSPAGNNSAQTIVCDAGGFPSSYNAQGGNDTITVEGGTYFGINGGNNRDQIDVVGGFVLGNIDGGSGRDTVEMSGGVILGTLGGGGGRDELSISGGTTSLMNGGNGNDTLNINGGLILISATGGDGNDEINMNGGTATTLGGGDGNDVININGGNITLGVGGGDGDDIVNLSNTAQIDDIGGTIGGGTDGETTGDVLNWDVGGTQSVTTGTFANFEIINITGSGRLEVSAGQELEGDTINFAVGSTVGGSGTLVGDVNFAGTVSPGSSPGILTVNGNAAFDSTADLMFGLLDLGADGNYTRGTDYDGIDVTGDVILTGDVNINIMFDAFPGVLTTGSIFDFINFGGTFIDNGFSFLLGDVFYDRNADWQIVLVGGGIQLVYVGPNVTVPAPGALGLLGAGVAMIAGLRRRRNTRTR